MKKGDETGDETQHNYNHRHVNDHGEQDEEEAGWLMREPGRKPGSSYSLNCSFFNNVLGMRML